MANIEDVAKKAGVSKALVSRYLNRKKGVSAEKKECISAAIEELGYRRNDLARSLVTKKTETIGVVFDTMCYVQIWNLIQGLNEMSAKSGYKIIYCDCTQRNGQSSLELKLQYIDFLTHNRVDGVVLYGSFESDRTVVSELIASSFPFVLIENDIPGLKANKVLVDNRGGLRQITDYFIQQGYRDIRYVCWGMKTCAGKERYEGYLEGLRRNGIQPEESRIYGKEAELGTQEEIRSLMESLREQNDLPEVFLFGCDQMAFDAILSFRQLGEADFSGIRIGGFDHDYYINQHIIMPRLTTVEQPLYEMGQEAVRMLVRSMEHPEEEPQQKTFETTLVEGET